MDNQVYMVGAAPALDPSASYLSYGHSVIVSPWGDILAEADENACMLSAEIDLEEVKRVCGSSCLFSFIGEPICIIDAYICRLRILIGHLPDMKQLRRSSAGSLAISIIFSFSFADLFNHSVNPIRRFGPFCKERRLFIFIQPAGKHPYGFFIHMFFSQGL